MIGDNEWKDRERQLREEQAKPSGKPAGPWTHIKRAPVKRMTPEEIAEFLKGRPDLPG